MLKINSFKKYLRNILDKKKNSVLFKFYIILLIIIFTFSIFSFFIIYYLNKDLINTLYSTRLKTINKEIEINKNNFLKNNLTPIKTYIQNQKTILEKALFCAEKNNIKNILKNIISFSGIKAVVIYDLMLNKPFLAIYKEKSGSAIFTNKIQNLSNLSYEKIPLYYLPENNRHIGYISFYYNKDFYIQNLIKLKNKLKQEVKSEILFANQILKKSLILHIIIIFIMFLILYISLHILFKKIIFEPLKKLEFNLKNFFEFLSNKKEKINLINIESNDEFGEMGKFINKGINVSMLIQKNIEKHTEYIHKLITVIEQSPVGIMFVDSKGIIEYVNKSFEKITGFTSRELKNKNVQILKNDLRDSQFFENLYKTILSGKIWKDTLKNRRKNGEIYYAISIVFPIKDKNNKIINYAAIKQDITEEKKLQEQLFQLQKMEAIGALAGGIAHDFNNLLTVINGISELLLMKMDSKNPFYKKIVSIHDAGERAKQLTEQLLAFSRKQVYEPKILDINNIVKSMEKMFRRLIDEDISIEINLKENIHKIEANESQIEQILLNILVNARDALREINQPNYRKKIKIKTDEIFISKNYFLKKEQYNKKGKYIVLTISDNGIGMDEETKQKIFEPFFTTKDKDKGTGLGLSTVYGIIKQINGFVEVETELNKGTTFKIFLPALIPKNKLLEKNINSDMILTGNETILIVEDKEDVLQFTTNALISLGYKVFSAHNGKEALKILTSNNNLIDLIITDIVMPELNGKELAEQVKKLYPNIKIIFVSGYTDDIILQKDLYSNDIEFLHKPFSIKTLSQVVRKVLDGDR